MNATASTVTVRSTSPRAPADYLGEDLTVAVAADARVSKAVGARYERITLGELIVGEKLRVEGVIDACCWGLPPCVGKRLVMRRCCPSTPSSASPSAGPVTAVDAAAGTLTARMNRVTRALSPYYHATCDFVVAPGARIWVMKDGWPVRASLADVVVGDRVYAQGGADRSMPSAPVFTIRWMVVRHVTETSATP